MPFPGHLVSAGFDAIPQHFPGSRPENPRRTRTLESSVGPRSAEKATGNFSDSTAVRNRPQLLFGRTRTDTTGDDVGKVTHLKQHF
jgi:hypothetical protein